VVGAGPWSGWSYPNRYERLVQQPALGQAVSRVTWGCAADCLGIRRPAPGLCSLRNAGLVGYRVLSAQGWITVSATTESCSSLRMFTYSRNIFLEAGELVREQRRGAPPQFAVQSMFACAAEKPLEAVARQTLAASRPYRQSAARTQADRVDAPLHFAGGRVPAMLQLGAVRGRMGKTMHVAGSPRIRRAA
jgi:hypothetical protein